MTYDNATTRNTINWNFDNKRTLNAFYELLTFTLEKDMTICAPLYCNRLCNKCNHKHGINFNIDFNKFTPIICNCAMQILGVTRSKRLVVPGWSAHVKEVCWIKKCILTWIFYNSHIHVLWLTRCDMLARDSNMSCSSAGRRTIWGPRRCLISCRRDRQGHSGTRCILWIPRRTKLPKGGIKIADLWRGKYN